MAARCSPPYTLSRIIVSAHDRISLRVCANAFWEEKTRYELSVLYHVCSAIIRKTLSVLLYVQVSSVVAHLLVYSYTQW